MGSVSKNNDCQKQSCVIMPYWLYAQNVSALDETHDFQPDCHYGAQSATRGHEAGRQDSPKREIFVIPRCGIYRCMMALLES
jgi:hypothetical protein